MAFKFPFTNYHELNLTWVLDQLKSLFEKSEENVTVIENYNGRLTAVETELPLVEETAQGASQQAAAAATLAQQAKSAADTAQENAIQAQGLAGTARQEAQAAQSAADAATQAAQQAQATAQNFDGRITQAENDAASALEASRSFETRVQAAITTANNAAQTATNAQGIATRADQNAALALDTLKAQRSELERIGAEQVERITEETESGKTEIENLAQSVLDSIPSDYTALSNLVDKKAPVIINSASGAVASFNDGADNMKIQKLVVNIEPVQAGSGDPSPDNVRPISGWTGAEISGTGVNVWDEETRIGAYNSQGVFVTGYNFICNLNPVSVIPNTSYVSTNSLIRWEYDASMTLLVAAAVCHRGKPFTVSASTKFINFRTNYEATTYNHDISINYPATDTTYQPYTGNQISVNWKDEAGTVYKGTLTYDGNETWTIQPIYVLASVTRRFFADATEVGAYGNSMYIRNAFYERGNGVTYRNRSRRAGGYYCISNVFKVNYFNDTEVISTQYRIYFAKPAGVTDKASLLNVVDSIYASGGTIDFLYQPTDPIPSITVTTEQLKTLYGNNNIWANTGDVEVSYPADTKLYIDGKLAELQATILENI